MISILASILAMFFYTSLPTRSSRYYVIGASLSEPLTLRVVRWLCLCRTSVWATGESFSVIFWSGVCSARRCTYIRRLVPYPVPFITATLHLISIVIVLLCFSLYTLYSTNTMSYTMLSLLDTRPYLRALGTACYSYGSHHGQFYRL